MASLNRVVIMGNLGQDPELRYTQNQMAVATLRIATTDYRTSPDGQRQEFTEWHRVVVWGKQAENCSKYLTKGRSCLVEGRLATRSWEDKQGQKRYTTEIVAQNVQFIGGGAGAGAGAPRGDRPAGGQPSQGGGGYDQDVGHMGEGGNFGGSHDSPSLDDIPF